MMYPVIGFKTLNNIISGYLVIFTGAIIGNFADAAINRNIGNAQKSLISLLGAIIITILFIPIMNFIANYILFKASLKYQEFILSKYIQKSYEDIINYDIGEISYRLEMDAIDLVWVVIKLISVSIATIIVFAGLVFNLYKIDSTCTIVCLLIGVIPVIISVFSSKLEKKYELERKKYDQKLRDAQADICNNFIFIKLYRIKDVILKNFSGLFYSYYNKTIKKSIKCKGIVYFLNKLSSFLCQVSILLLGAYLISIGNIKAGALASIMLYFSKVQDIYIDVSGIVKNLNLLPQCLSRVGELYSNPDYNSKEVMSDFYELEAHNVSYKFKNGKEAFKDISFNVKSGDKVAIVGANGSGKSTLLKIISRLYDNYEGNIKLNGKELNSFELNSFRTNIAYLEQEPFLFNLDIYNNVQLGNLSSCHEQIEKNIQVVGLSEMKHKEISALGTNLSGGEKQRVSIARALLRNPHILFMDEPFNNLDTKGKELIETILKDKSRTIIYITHDYELLRYANVVVNMNNKESKIDTSNNLDYKARLI